MIIKKRRKINWLYVNIVLFICLIGCVARTTCLIKKDIEKIITEEREAIINGGVKKENCELCGDGGTDV